MIVLDDDVSKVRSPCLFIQPHCSSACSPDGGRETEEGELEGACGGGGQEKILQNGRGLVGEEGLSINHSMRYFVFGTNTQDRINQAKNQSTTNG